MEGQNWINYKEFNEKTAANYRKHQKEKAAILRHARRMAAVNRWRNRLIVLDLSLAGVALMALGVLAGLLV